MPTPPTYSQSQVRELLTQHLQKTVLPLLAGHLVKTGTVASHDDEVQHVEGIVHDIGLSTDGTVWFEVAIPGYGMAVVHLEELE
jgi:hypothetical protein